MKLHSTFIGMKLKVQDKFSTYHHIKYVVCVENMKKWSKQERKQSGFVSNNIERAQNISSDDFYEV